MTPDEAGRSEAAAFLIGVALGMVIAAIIIGALLVVTS